MARMSAEERREHVLRAAVTEFARGGYHGASTGAIARRAGISQPYLFRLFPGKQALFDAAALRCVEDTRTLLTTAAQGLPHPARPAAMAAAYQRLIADPDQALMLLQICAATVAGPAGDGAAGRTLREHWSRLWDELHQTLGGDTDTTAGFVATGMLINALLAMDFPRAHRVWSPFRAPAP